MPTNSDQRRQPEPIDRRRLVLSLGVSLLVIMLCLFLPAGTWAWQGAGYSWSCWLWRRS